jgi:hypothetical protein
VSDHERIVRRNGGNRVEPDQIDMMNEQELRNELRKLVNKVITYEKALKAIRDIDYRGSRHESAHIACAIIGDV